MSGGDHPPQAAYQAWAQATDNPTTWDQLTPAQQVIWESVANAAIDANG